MLKRIWNKLEVSILKASVRSLEYHGFVILDTVKWDNTRLVDWDEMPAPGDQNEGTEPLYDSSDRKKILALSLSPLPID